MHIFAHGLERKSPISGTSFSYKYLVTAENSIYDLKNCLLIYLSSPTPTSLLRLKVHIIGRSSGAMMVILIYCAVVHQGWTTDLPHMRRIRHAKTFFFKPHQIQTQPDEVGNSTILCSLQLRPRGWPPFPPLHLFLHYIESLLKMYTGTA